MLVLLRIFSIQLCKTIPVRQNLLHKKESEVSPVKDQAILMRYYKHKFYHGRGFLARAVDFLALRIITLAACYLWFTTLIDNTIMAAALSITALTTISVAVELAKSLRLERFIQKERKRIAERLFRERLLILPKEDFLAVVKAYLEDQREKFADDCLVYTVQSAEPVSADTVLRAHRAAERRGLTAAVIFSAAHVSAEAAALVHRYDGATISFVTPDNLIANASAARFLPDEKAVDAAILAAARAEKARRKKNASAPFAAGRMRRYILVALALFALSFFVKYTLYYRLLSAACLSFGALAWWLNNLAPAGDPGSSTV